jgi:hypothetical protein
MMKIATVLSLVFLASCNANPFKGTDVSANPPPLRYEVRPALGIDALPIMRFDEGKTGEYAIKFVVPSGEAILEFEDLPQGASFDQSKGVLQWTPDYTQANDRSSYTVKTREYPVTIILSSSVDVTTAVRKTVMLQVHDTPRPMVVQNLATSYAMKEGETKTHTTFTVTADDYAAADVRAELKDSAMGMKLERQGSRAEWVLKAEYGIDKLRVGTECRSSSSCTVALDNSIVLTGPDGRQHSQDFRINLQDVRQETRTSLPTALVVKGDMSQAFTVSDGNKEVAPKVTLTSTPPVGIFQLRLVSDAPPESNYELSWTDIPADASGQSYDIELSICNSNYGFSTNTTRCKPHRMRLSVEERTFALPTISRGSWGNEEIKYLMLNSTLDHTVAIDAGSSGLRLRSSSVTSSDATDVVSLSGNQVRINAKRSGLKTLTVSAVNSVGGVANAVFLYEVLPANWGENVLLAPISNAPEFSPLENLWTKTARVYHGGHNLNARALMFRKSVTVGTQSMGMPEIAADLSFFAKNVKRILVTTPMLASLPADILAELNEKGLHLGSRASSVPNFKLSDFELEVVRDLGIPSKRAGLKGVTSKESQYPMFLEISLESTDCKELFGLIKTGEVTEQYVLGASCSLSGGRKIVVLGFEWADFQLTDSDTWLERQWFQRIWE